MGQTVLIESEQLYVTAISTNDLTVVRGINGTTASTHADGTDISIYRYPETVAEACLIQASRLWKRKDARFAARSGLPQGDGLRGLDPDVKQLLGPYRRHPLGLGTW